MSDTWEIGDLVCVVLPLVELQNGESVKIGPVTFWSADKYRKYVNKDLHEAFRRYMDHVYLTIHARVDNEIEKGDSPISKDIPVRTKELNQVTCGSVKTANPELRLLGTFQKYDLIADAVNVLCFLANTNIRLGFTQSPIDLRTFQDLDLIDVNLLQGNNWPTTMWFYYDERYHTQVNAVCKELSKCFGKILVTQLSTYNPRWANRIIRAIKYCNKIFLSRDAKHFRLYYTQEEHIVSLAIAYEALLDLHSASPNQKETTDKFLHSIQRMFDIKSSYVRKSLENWLRDYYKLRSCIIHGDTIPDKYVHRSTKDIIARKYIGTAMKVFFAVLIYELRSHTCLEPRLLEEKTLINECLKCILPEIKILRQIYMMLKNLNPEEIEKRREDIDIVLLELQALVEFYEATYNEESKDANVENFIRTVKMKAKRIEKLIDKKEYPEYMRSIKKLVKFCDRKLSK